jgi:hypothetical protein
LGLIHGYFGMGEASEAARLEAQRARADFKAMLERSGEALPAPFEKGGRQTRWNSETRLSASGQSTF